jgi:hypothetical protein
LIPLRALIVAEAELGGRIVRALILRRSLTQRAGIDRGIAISGCPEMLFAQYGAGARDVLVACPNGIIIAILRLNEAQRLNRVFREVHCELWLFKTKAFDKYGTLALYRLVPNAS